MGIHPRDAPRAAATLQTHRRRAVKRARRLQLTLRVIAIKSALRAHLLRALRDVSPLRALRHRGRSRELRELTEPRYSSLRAEDVPLGPVISNPLDEAQSEERPERRPLLNPSTADYGFRPRDPAEACRQAFQQSLALHAIGPAARTPEELALRTSLRERLLTPQSTTVAEYRERLRLQAQQKSVPAMRTYPMVLRPGEDSI
ncbi:hypothetical protein PHYSODRAFT_342866, partial [Phytophthora sojae]